MEAKFILNNIYPFTGELENNVCYLVIQNVNNIPPHIGLILKNKYYSTAVSGVKTGIGIESVLKNIQQKNIPSLFIQLNDFVVMEQLAESIFFNYGPLNDANKSCLFPIISVLNNALNLDLKGEFIFELLPELEKLNLIERCYSLNMQLENKLFEFKNYSRADINFCISELNGKLI